MGNEDKSVTKEEKEANKQVFHRIWVHPLWYVNGEMANFRFLQKMLKSFG